MKKVSKLVTFGQDRNFISLFYIILSFLIASVSVGINVVVFPAILIDNDINAFLIGVTATSEMIFGFLAAVLVSRIIYRFGAIPTVIFITLAYSTIIYFIFFYQNYLLWLVLQSMTGVFWLFLYIIRQAWINNLVSGNNRSIVVALISSIFCSGFIAGSSLVKIFGALNHTCLIISSILIFISGMMLVLIKNTFPKSIDSADHVKFKTIFKKLPNDAIARFLLDFQVGCLIFLGVLFGSQVGFSAENSGLLIAAFMASGVFDLYAGFLAKYYDRAKLIIFAFIGCLITLSLSIIFYQDFYVLMLLFFCFGLGCAMIMVTTLTNVNDAFDKSQLVAANATFQAIGSLGTIVGCLIGGTLMFLFDFYGFFATILMSIVTYLVYFGFFRKKQAVIVRS